MSYAPSGRNMNRRRRRKKEKEIIRASLGCLNHSDYVQISWFAIQEQQNSASYKK
jgi:hypothetical protein